MKNLRDIVLTVALVIAVIVVMSMLTTTRPSSSPADDIVPQQPAPEVTGITLVTVTYAPVATTVPDNTPTATPGVIDEVLWTPTPIVMEALPSPQRGLVNAVGRILCSGTVAKRQFVYIVRIEGDSYVLAQMGYTDETDRWLLRDAVPGVYTVMTKPPKSFGKALVGTWELKDDQLVDFGDVNFASSLCDQ